MSSTSKSELQISICYIGLSLGCLMFCEVVLHLYRSGKLFSFNIEIMIFSS